MRLFCFFAQAGNIFVCLRCLFVCVQEKDGVSSRIISQYEVHSACQMEEKNEMKLALFVLSCGT